MTLWIVFGVMCLVAIAIAVLPLLRAEKTSPLPVVATIAVVVAVAAGTYAFTGSPGVPSGAGTVPDINEMVESLATRLESEPDDVDGWRMLGRSYMSLEEFSAATGAFEKAVELESGENADTLVSLAESILADTQGPIEGRIASLFDNALALNPNHPQALFYGGIAAINRNNRVEAANRWERLLGLNPPAEIRGILEQRVAEWRGLPPPVASAAPTNQRPGTAVTLVSASVALSERAEQAAGPDAVVFIFARDPRQPTPPIAAKRLKVSELPATVAMSDADAMIPGRNLSAFEEFELVARVSMNGGPAAQPGDWFGSKMITPAETGTVEILIDSQLP